MKDVEIYDYIWKVAVVFVLSMISLNLSGIMGALI